MMRVYFVRHGERADNSDSIFAKPDIPLSKNGRQQAALLAQRFASIPVEVIYTSPYVRTRETAEILNAVIKTEIHDNMLIEELGEREERETIYKRSNEFVQFLKDQEKHRCILVSAHQGIIKMIIFAMVFGEVHLDRAFAVFDASFNMDFTGITFCKRKKETVDEKNPPWIVVTWNDLGHLPPPE
jgi:broad specificity phosphatase PhoE